MSCTRRKNLDTQSRARRSIERETDYTPLRRGRFAVIAASAASHHKAQTWIGLVRSAVVSLLLLSFLAMPRVAQADDNLPRFVGQFTPEPSPVEGTVNLLDLRLFTAPDSRVLYVVHGTSPGWIRAYDLDTLKPIGPGLTLKGRRAAVGVIEPKTNDLIIPTGTDLTTDQLERFGVDRGQLVARGTFPLQTTLGGRLVVGMTLEPGTSRAYLLAALLNSIGDGTAIVVQADIGGMTQGTAAVKWTAPLNGCQDFVYDSRWGSGVGYVSESHSLLFACRGAGKGYGFFGHPPLAGGAARLTLTGADNSAAGPFQLYRYPLDFDPSNAGSFYDPISKRLLVFGTENATQQFGLVFDAKASAYVGRASLGPADGFNMVGLNPANGRLYAISSKTSDGLKTVDVRATPVGQGQRYPNLANNGRNPAAQLGLAIDPPTSRLFAAYVSETSFDIIQDRVPAYEPPGEADPDIGTANIPEVPGKTGATWSAGAQAYGARYRLVGGTGALQLNLTHLDSTPAERPGSRETRVAWLNQLTLSDQEASASGITADRDVETTAKDQQDVSNAVTDSGRQIAPDAIGAFNSNVKQTTGGEDGWPYQLSNCADFGGQAVSRNEDGTVAACDLDSAKSRFTSSLTGLDGGDIAVDKTSVDATSFRDLKDGVTSTVTAEASGISLLGGRLKIGHVLAVATAKAHGRAGTAVADYKRSVSEVTLDGQKLCGDSCPLQTIADAVNQALGNYLRVDFPTPDKTASPRGYQAVVRQPLVREWEAVHLNLEPENLLTIPGMLVVFYHDNYTPGRLVVDLAGTEAEAHFGVFPSLNFGTDLGNDDSVAANLASIAGLNGDAGGNAGNLFAELAASPGAGDGLDGAPRLLDAPAGLRFVLNGLRRVVPMMLLWTILLIPIYLSARRWLLLQRESLLPGGPQ
jgi:hypothetical protein